MTSTCIWRCIYRQAYQISISHRSWNKMSDSQLYAPYILLSFFFTLLLLYFFQKSSKLPSHGRLPPSPPSLPLIGHLHHFSASIYKSFFDIAAQYGPLVYLRLGAMTCVIVSSSSLATEIFKTQDITFASRPRLAFRDELAYGRSGFFVSPYGEFWRFMKKLTMTELLSPKMVEKSRSIRYEEIARLINKLQSNAEKEEGVDMGVELMKVTNNSTCRMVMSTRCMGEDDEADKLSVLVKETFEIASKVAFGDVFGWPLKKLGFWLYGGKTMDVTLRYDNILERILQEHEERAKREGLERENMDLMDILLKVLQDKNAEFKINRTHIKAFNLDLFLAGTGTSTEVTQWALAELINHPDEFSKLRQEINTVVGNSRLVEEGDVPNLPYLQALVKETLRLYPAIPLVIRSCREDTEINGYNIPKNTMVLVNAYKIMRDPESWENPNEFKPERFFDLSKENDQMKHTQYEIKGQNSSFIPFGGGRRGCPGSTLAFNLISTVIAAMVQCFDWKVGRDGKESKVDMKIGPGFSLPMAKPFVCVPSIHFDPFAAKN